MTPTFCWCSAGGVQELHELVFGRPVKAELLESVLLGHPRCKHRITLA
jgi:predicted hydrocarbon binding protein